MKKNIFLFVSIFCAHLEAFDYNPWVLLKKFQAARADEHQNYENAKKLTHELITHNPHDTESIYNAGKAAYALNDFKQAENYFDAVAKEHDVLPDLKKRALFDLGNSQVRQQELERALESYKQLVEIDPAHEKAAEMIKQIEDELEKRKQQQQQENQDQKNNNGNNQKKSNDKQNDKQEKDQQNPDSKKNDEQNKQSPDQKNNDEKNDQQSDKKNEPKPNDSSSDKQKKGDQSKEEKKDGKQGSDEGNKSPEKKSEKGQERADGKEKQERNTGNNTQQKGERGGDERPEKPEAGDGQHNEKQEQKTPPELNKNKPTQEPKNEQGAPSQHDAQAPLQDDRLSQDEQLFLKRLDEHDAQALKRMLKVDVKKGMPVHHGQKNW
ncbi:tetratricopeptide repeat protein [Candidatus Dependentiae bacterium]|nr:tetratricopeptide repeat protein [Candidatus Dependentiae bacterium]